MKETLVVIIGAGASVEAGIPNTKQLTDLAKRTMPVIGIPGAAHLSRDEFSKPQQDRHYTVNNTHRYLADLIDQGLRADYGPNYDFEFILHALESLETFIDSRLNPDGLPAIDTPVLGAFAELMRRFSCIDDETLIRRARLDILKAVHREVGNRCERPYTATAGAARQQLERIFVALSAHFRIVAIDFNYDDIVDRFPLSWEDGFTERNDSRFCWMFSPGDWLTAVENGESNLLMHLHGSVRFGHRPMETVKDPTIRFAEPARYDQIDWAQRTVANTSMSVAKADGEIIDAFYIVSGLRKAGKLAYNARPYGYYFKTAMDFLPKASRLLVLGYGWRDVHLNTWVNEYAALHPERRTAVVTRRLGQEVGNMRSAEYQSLARVAGVSAWGKLHGRAYARQPWEPEGSRFKVVERFGIAPEGFVMTQEDEAALLNFMTERDTS